MNSMNQTFYRMLFDQSPVSLWVEDFTGILEKVQEYRAQGVNDLRAFFQTYPDQLAICISKLRVVDVNNTTLWLYKAKTKQELYENMHLIFRDEATCMATSCISISPGAYQEAKNAITKT